MEKSERLGGLGSFEEGSTVLSRHFNTGSGQVFGDFQEDLRVAGRVVCILLRICFYSPA